MSGDDVTLPFTTEQERARTIAFLSTLELTRRPTVVQIKPQRVGRTPAQNKRLWWLHGLTSAHLALTGLGNWTPERVHYRIFVPRYCKTARRIMVLGKETFEELTSSQLDLGEMSAAQTRYEIDMRNEGIDIPMDGPT